MTATVSKRTPATPATSTPTFRPVGGRVLVRGLIAALAVAPIAAYLWIAAHRIGYPFELDWMEGGSVELAARALAGHSLYTSPSLAFVGWTYTPLYYWLAAAVAKLAGIGFYSLRLVSLVASLVAMATLAGIVVRETGERIGGLVAAGLFAATFQISGAWFDTGRGDSLFVALILLAVAWGRAARGARGGIALGLLAFLAYFTKQTALVALAPVLGYLVLTRRGVGIAAVGTLVCLVLASTVLLDALTNGWYRYYVFSELASQAWATQVWIQFWTRDILEHQWPLLILVLASAIALTVRSGPRSALRAPGVYHVVAAAGLLGAAWLSRLHTGGYANVLMPAYAATALLAGLACARLLADGRRRVAAPLVVAALLAQLGLLAYPLGAQIPTAADRAAGTQLLAALRALPGNVVVLRHPWYATVAGKGSFAQGEGIGDVLRSAAPRGRRVLAASLSHALDADHVQAVVLDGAFDAHVFGPALEREFRLASGPITPTRLYPLTDVRTAPTLLYVRVRSPRPGQSARSAG